MMVLVQEISARYNLIQHDSLLNQFLNFRALNMVSVFQDQLVFFRFGCKTRQDIRVWVALSFTAVDDVNTTKVDVISLVFSRQD